MSADNYLYVGHVGDGRYGVWDCSMSEDNPLHRNRPFLTFDTPDEAIKAAHKQEREHHYEYGVSISEAVMAEWTKE